MGIFGFGIPKPASLIARGASEQATVVGIVVTGSGGGPPTTEYTLEVAVDQPFLAVARVPGEPPMPVRLGSTLQAFHHESHVVIDWLGSGAVEVVGAQGAKGAPERGIHDHTLGLEAMHRRGAPATGTLTAMEVRTSSRDGGARLHLSLLVERNGLAGYETELNLPGVPHYATHLCTVDRALPVWVMPEKPDQVVIDWPAAAGEVPGVDDPPAEILAGLAPAEVRSVRPSRSRRNRGVQGLVAASTQDGGIGDLAGGG